MIVGIDGNLGAGKSYMGVFLGLSQSMDSGKPLWSNLDVVGGERFSSWRQLMSIRRGIVLWDETHLDMDSRLFSQNVAITPWLTQIRKLDVELIYISQNIGQVDVRLRNLTDRLLRCEAAGVDGSRASKVYVVDWFNQRILNTLLVRHDPFIYARYNTRQLVMPLSGAPLSLAELSTLG